MTKDEFKEIRKKLNYSQAQIAKVMHVTQPQICNYESGKTNISPMVAAYVRDLRNEV